MWRSVLRALTLLFAVGLPSLTGAQAIDPNFDHTRTGFQLEGVHTRAKCESCHVSGIFKGTPKDCATCHSSGAIFSRGNVTKAPSHLPTQAPCETCHNPRSFSGAKFSHVGVASGSCASCHNGVTTQGKSANHIATSASCDSCHKSSTSWTAGAKVDHTPFTAATDCTSCHNGGTASGKSPVHIPSGVTNCVSCHSKTSWKPSTWNHSQVPVTSQCATCHSGAFAPADGKSPNHIPYAGVSGVGSANCDGCHKAGYALWTPAKFHASFAVATQCATCHTGSFAPAVGKPNTPIHAGVTVCESCHKSTASWSGAAVNHSTFTAATNCASCHNGTAATGKPPAHVPVGSTNCASCHNKSPQSWKPTLWNHSQVPVTSQCATCHSGAYPPADGKNPTHIPYASVSGVGNASCDGCHKSGYVLWTPARFHGSFTVATQCASCHTGSFAPAVGKPNTPIHVGVTVCESCHKSTASWSGAAVNHSTFTIATNCASCHNGTAATGKPVNHMPVGVTACGSCHNKSPQSWKPTLWNHSQVPVASQCATCHSGAYPPADGKRANHIPYATVTGVGNANCDGCHKAGYALWTPARFHSSFTVSTQCASCHSGSFAPAVGKPNTPVHVGVTACESCHKSTAAWSTVTFSHSPANAVGTGTCDTCHNGSAAKGKTPAHIPVTSGVTKCDSCHKSQASFATAVTMNHAVVVATTCKTCHAGAYVSQGALAKPTNHIPEATQLLNGAAMDCNSCHKSTVSFATAVTMTHNTSLGNGAGWCKGCHQTGTNFLGSMDKKSLTHDRASPLPTDCSQSGCHRPLGSKGTPYTKWN